MTPPSRVRLTRWGKDHYDDEDRTTFCDLVIGPNPLKPKGRLLCVDCRKEAQRRGMAALQEEMDARARERERKLARQRAPA